MTADAKTADGPQTFAEGADHKVYAFFDAGFFRQAAAIVTENPQ